MKGFSRLFAVLLCTAAFVACGQSDGNTSDLSVETKRAASLDQAMTTAILGQNAGAYYPGEFQGAGYLIFETIVQGKTTSVYALTEYIEYGFQDHDFVNVSGTRAKVLLNFETSQGEAYRLLDYICIDETSELSEERRIELLRPLKETGKDYTYTGQELQELCAQVDTQAEEYLKSIGRQANVRQCDTHQESALSALGVKEEVYLMLIKDETIGLYPDWHGNLERVEDGNRFVYQTYYDREAKKIIYTKTGYDTNDLVERLIFDASSGQCIAS